MLRYYIQEGAPRPAAPAFDEDTEMRMETIIDERVSARLADAVRQAHDLSRQEVRLTVLVKLPLTLKGQAVWCAARLLLPRCPAVHWAAIKTYRASW